MKRPEPIGAREFVDGLPYIGEYYQPDSRVYIKAKADAYFEYLESKIKELEEYKYMYEDLCK